MKRSTLYLLVSLMLIAFGVNAAKAGLLQAQARYIAAASVQSNQINLAWINGNGTKRIVVAYDLANGAADWAPVRTALGTTTAEFTDAGGDFSNGSIQSISGYANYKVVDVLAGAARTSPITNLTAGHTYAFHVFEYRMNGGAAVYDTDGATMNPREIATIDLAPPTGLLVTANSEGGKITWTNATNATGYFLDVFDIDAVDFASGYDMLDIGNPSQAFWIMGLTASKSYKFRMRSYNSANKVSVATSWVNFTTAAAPAYTLTSWLTESPTVLKIDETATVMLTTSPLQTGLQPKAATATINGVDVSSIFIETSEGVYIFMYKVEAGHTDRTAGGALPINITLKDGNNIDGNNISASGATAPGVDANKPTISSFLPWDETNNDSNPGTIDGTYKIGDKINFAATFSENINITGGTPQVALVLTSTQGGATRYAVYDNTHADNTDSRKIFTYTVVEGDVASDLTINGGASAGVMDLNGASVTDAAGNALTALSLTTTGDGFATAQAIVVDGVKPTVTSIARKTPAGEKTNTNAVTWLVTFSENIDNASIAMTDFTVTAVAGTNNGSVSAVTATGVTPINTYDVTVSSIDNDNSTIRLDLTGSVDDVAGNASTATFNTGETYLIDNAAPTATISAPVADKYVKSIATISVTASDAGTPNSGLNKVYVAVWLDNATVNGTFNNAEDFYWNGANFTTANTVQWQEATLDAEHGTWSYALSIPGGNGVYYIQTKVTDNAGNETTQAEGTATHKFIIDNTAPTQAAPAVVATGNNVVTGYYNSTNTGFDIPVVLADDASLEGGTFKVQYQTADDNGFTTNPSAWADVTAIATDTIAVGEIDTTVTKSLTDAQFEALVAEGKFIRFQVITTDQAGNSKTSDASSAVQRKESLPTISSGSAVAAASNGATDYIDITFSEGVYTNAAGTDALTGADFNDLAFVKGANGTATAATKVSAKQADHAGQGAAGALTGGATVVRLFFDVTGTPSGVETVEVKAANGSAIYDKAGNAVAVAQTTGTKKLRDQTAPVIAIVSDNGATFVKEGNEVTITFYVTEVGGLSANPTVTILQNDGNAIAVGQTATYFSRTGTGSVGDPYFYTYKYTVPSYATLGNSDYADVRIKVEATDAAGNAAAPFVLTVNTFTIDNTLPVLSVTAPDANTRTNGTQLLEFNRTEANPSTNNYAKIGAAEAAVFTSGSAISTIAGWGDVADNATFTVTLSHTDLAGNVGTTTRDFVKDITAPTATTLTIASNNTHTDVAKNGNTVTVTIVTNEDVSITAQTIGGKAANAAGSNKNWTVTRVLDGSESDGVVDFSITLQDVAGNTKTITKLDITNSSSVTIDNAAPADAQISAVTTVTAPVTTGYWNASNTALEITVPVANDASLEGGTIQLQASTDDFTTPLALDAAYTILNGDLNKDKSFTISKATFEALVGFAEGNVYKFRAVVTDKAGNATNGTAAAQTITVDRVAPAECTIASRTSVTGTVVANYFNSTNDRVDVVVNIPNDATLNGGKATLQARVGANDFVNVGQLDVAIAGGEVNSTKTLSIAKTGTANTDLDELDGWANTVVNVDFRVVLADIAGNATTGTTFGTSLAVDMAAPAAPTVTLNGGNPINNTNHSAVSLSFTHAGGDIATYSYTIADAGNAHTVTNNAVAIAASPVSFNSDLSTFDDGTITATVTLTDAAGNTSTAGTDTETKNSSPATVTNVTVTNADGTYPIGANITVRVTFSKVIAFDPGNGNIGIALETGTTDRIATKSAAQLIGAGLNYIDLVYTVQENDVAADLDYTAITSLAFTGTASITDVDGNPVTVLTLPNPGDVANSIAGQKAIVIDGVKPTFALQYYYNAALTTAAPDNPVFSAGTNVYLKITSSKALKEPPTVAIDAQGNANDVATVATESLSDTEYYYYRTFVADATTDGTVKEAITIIGESQTGNTVTAVANVASPSYVTSGDAKLASVDCSAPTFTVTYYTNSNYTAGEVATGSKLKAGTYYVKVVANETLASAPKLSFTTQSATNTKTNQNTTWDAGLSAYKYQRVIAQDNADNGTVAEIVKVSGMDQAGNAATNVAPTNTQVIYIDAKAPVITPVNIASNNITNNAFAVTGNEITITLTSDEVLSGVTVSSFTIDEAAYGGDDPVVANNGNVWTVKYTVVDDDDNGMISFGLIATDLAGNTTNVTAVTDLSSVTVDRVAPVIEPVTVASDNSITPATYARYDNTITISLTSNEALSGLTVNTFTIGGTAYKGAAPVVANPENNNWTVKYKVVEGDDNGAVAFSFTATDKAGNTATVGALTSGSMTVDKVAPGLTYVSSTPTYVKNNTLVTINFKSNEQLSVANTSGTIKGRTGTVTYVNEDPGGTFNYTLTYTIPENEAALEQGAMTYSITGKDIAANQSAISGTSGTTYDREGPAVALTNNISGRTEVKNGTTVRITATFTDAAGTAINETPVPTITITNGQGASGDITNANMEKTSNTVWYYDWAVPTGTYACAVTVSGADVAGNNAAAATGVTSYTVDNTAPTVAVSNSIAGRTNVRAADGSITLTATFTEANTIATGASAPTISIDYSTSADVSNAAMTVDELNPKVYTYSWTPPNTNETATFTISASDVAGNASAAATGDLVYTIDNTAPTVTLSTPAAEYLNAAYTVTVTFSEAVTGFDVSDITKTGTGTAAISDFTNTVAGTTWTFVVTPSAEGTIILDVNAGVAVDAAGNQNTAATTLTRTYDITAPTIGTRTIATSGNTVGGVKYAKVGNEITLTIEASEPITKPTVTIGGETATVSGDAPNTTYTATITVDATHPAAEGEAAINISGYTDRASNSGGVYNTLSGGTLVVVDRVKPTITGAGNVLVGTGLANRFYIDLTFSEAVYTNADGTGALAVADFANPVIVTGADGAVTSATITHVTQTDNTDPASATALAAGATTARVFFTTDAAPTSNETITLNLNNTSVYDIAGNDAAGQTTGAKTFPDKTAPAISNIAVNGVSNGQLWLKSGATATITFNMVEVGGITANPTLAVVTAGDGLIGNPSFVSRTGSGTDAAKYVYTYTFTVPVGDYPGVKVNINATDNAGNNVTPALNPAFDIDNTKPTVAITRANITNGSNYRTNDGAVTFNIKFSEPVINFNENDITVNYTGTTGTRDAITVVNATLGEYKQTISSVTGDGTISITINNAGFTDRAANQMAADAGPSDAFTIDNTAPVANTVTPSPTMINGDDIGNGKFTITVDFDSPMNTSVNPTITFPTENPTSIAFASGAWTDEDTYVATYNVTSDGLVLSDIDIRVTGAKDLAGNVMTQKDVTDAFSINLNVPTLTAVGIAAAPSGSYAKTGDVVTLTFTGSVALKAKPTVTIAGHAIADGSITNTVGNTWTATYAMTAGDTEGAVPFTIDFMNLADNPGAQVTTVTDASSVTFDKTAPTLDFTAPAVDARVNGTQTITYSLDDANASANTQARIGAGAYTNFASGSAISTLAGFGALGQGNFTVDLQHTDQAGNVTTVSRQFYKDTDAPSITPVTVASTNSVTSATQAKLGDEITISLTSNEVLSGLTVNTFTIGGTAYKGDAPAAAHSGGNVWTVKYTVVAGDGNGALAFSFTATDLAGNTATVNALTTGSMTVDKVAPAIATRVLSTNGNPGYAKVGNTITLTLTASESITKPTVTIAGAAATVSPDGPATSYTATLEVGASTTEGNAVVSVTGYTDISGNAGESYNTASSGAVIVDRTAPTLAFTTPSTPVADTRVNGTQTITYSLNDANASANTQARIGAGAYANFASGSAISTLAGFGALGQGNFTVDLQHTDQAGNVTTVSRQFYKDTDAPTATTVAFNKTSLNRTDIGDDKFVVTITYSEAMDQTVAPTIAFSNPDPAAVLSAGTTPSDWTSATEYKAYYKITDDNTNYADVDITVSGAKDLAGNVMTQKDVADAFSITLEAPTLSTVTIASNNANTTWAKVGDEVTITIVGSENLQNVTATINGVNATIAGSDKNWTAKVTMTGGMTDGTVGFAINFEDLAGNPGTQVTAITGGSNVTFDKTAPTISITAPAANARVNNRAIAFNITETNTGTTEASADGSTFAAFASGAMANTLGGWGSIADNATFTATIRHTDLAGNVGTATISLVKDITAPTIASLDLSCNNAVATLTFSEGVYGNSDGTGQLSDAKISATRGGSGAQITTKMLTPVPAAGSATATISLMWNGSFTGNEIVTIDAANSTSIYDEAGNALVTGSPATHYTNIPITISQQPQNTQVCLNANTTISVTANGGHSTAYQWQKYDGVEWVDLENDATYSNVTTNTLGITNAVQVLDGAQYRVIISNDCNSGVSATISNAATLTINSLTAIDTHPAASTICASEQAQLSVTASGTAPYTYTWKYYNGSSWVNAVNGTPAGATYTNLNSNSISVSGLSAGSYKYKVSVLGACGVAVESNEATITVNALPNALANAVSAEDAQICATYSTNIIIENTDASLTYQLFDGTNLVGDAVVGSDDDLSLPTGNLAETTTFSVVVTNASNCSATLNSTATVTVNPAPDASIVEGNALATCAGTPVTLTAAEEDAVSYNWFETSAPLVSLGTDRTLSVSATGTYKVTVSKGGCEVTTATGTTVTINPLPVPTISGVNSAVTDQEVVLSTEAGKDNYVWNVDGGTVTAGSINSNTVTVKWATAGAKSVTVTYDQNGCSPAAAATYTVTVTPACTPVSITAHPAAQTECEGSNVTLSVTATGTAPITYKWYKVGNMSVLGTNSTYTITNAQVADAGQYYVVVSNNCPSDATSNNATVSITAKAVTSVSIALTSGTNPMCVGSSVTFTATPSNGGTPTYQWKVNGNNVGGNTSTYTYTPQNGDTVKVEMTSSLSCVTAQTVESNELTMTVNPLPTPTITGGTDVAVNTAIVLTTQPGMTSYSWSASDGGVITNGNTNAASITWSTLGTKTVTVTYTNANGCTGTSDSYEVNVVQGCVNVAISAQPQSQSTCVGGDAVFSVTATGSAPITYAWYKDGSVNVLSTSSTLTITNAQAADAGQYYVVVSNTCPSSVTSGNATLTVNALPSATASNNGPKCVGEEVTLSAGGGVSYSWSGPGGYTSALQNPTTTVAGTYTVTVTNADGCTATAQTTVTFNALPSATASNDGPKCVGEEVTLSASGGVSYSWSGPGGYTSALQNPTITVAGTYTVTVTNADGCTATATTTVPAFMTSPTITSQPTAGRVMVGGSTSFTVGANNATSYAWQLSTDGGATWTTISNGGVYSGSTTSTLSLTGVTAAMVGSKYKAVVSGNCGSIESGVVSIVIAALAPTEPITFERTSPNFSTIIIDRIAAADEQTTGKSRIVVIRKAAQPTDPVDGNKYPAKSIFGAGYDLGGASYVVLDSNITSITVTGLQSSTSYHIAIYGYNMLGDDPASISYNTTLLPLNSAGSNYRSITTRRKVAIDEQEPLFVESFDVSRVTPNPVSSEMNFVLNTAEGGQFTFELYNSIGEMVYSRNMQVFAGANSIKLPITLPGGLSAGKYNLRVVNGIEYIDQQIIIMP